MTDHTPASGLPPTTRAHRLRRRLRRVVLARRRPLAALCAAAAVLSGVQALRPPAQDTVVVEVAAHDLVSGTVLGPRDLVPRAFPAEVAPARSVRDAVGRTLAAPLRRGEPVTDVRLVAPGLMRGYPGRVAVPVRIADADMVGLLRVGDPIDLVAADPRRGTATELAVDVPVVALPVTEGDLSSGAGVAGVPSGRLVVVAVRPEDVDRIAGAAATDLLSVVIPG